VQNENKPLWTRTPKEVEKAEYDEFFKMTFKEFMAPAAHSHFAVEGKWATEWNPSERLAPFACGKPPWWEAALVGSRLGGWVPLGSRGSVLNPFEPQHGLSGG